MNFRFELKTKNTELFFSNRSAFLRLTHFGDHSPLELVFWDYFDQNSEYKYFTRKFAVKFLKLFDTQDKKETDYISFMRGYHYPTVVIYEDDRGRVQEIKFGPCVDDTRTNLKSLSRHFYVVRLPKFSSFLFHKGRDV